MSEVEMKLREIIRLQKEVIEVKDKIIHELNRDMDGTLMELNRLKALVAERG